MADEPNPKMERVLRDYAGARRKEADFPLHPATRNMLHGEVARTYRAPDRRSVTQRLRAWWPQIAFASGLGVILVIAVVSLRTPGRIDLDGEARAPASSELAEKLEQDKDVAGGARRYLDASNLQNAPGSSTSPEEQLAKLPNGQETEPAAQQPDDSPVETLADARQQAARPDNLRSLSADSASVTPPAAPSANEDFALKPALRTPALAQAGQLADRMEQKETVALRGALAPEKVARVSALTNLGAAMRVHFVELAPPARRGTRPQLLTAFQMEQAGDDVRIFDQDGSIYTGQLFPHPSEAEATNVVPSATARSQALPQFAENSAVHLFFAAGTNRTLASEVTIEGEYLERTNAPVAAAEASISLSSASTRAGRSNITTNSRFKRAIVGKATVAQTNQFPVTAVSVEP